MLATVIENQLINVDLEYVWKYSSLPGRIHIGLVQVCLVIWIMKKKHKNIKHHYAIKSVKQVFDQKEHPMLP